MIKWLKSNLRNNLAGILLITSAIYFATLIESADILANIIANIILGVSLLYLIYLLLGYYLIKNKLSFQLDQANQRITSQNQHQFNYQFQSFKLLPGTRLTVRPLFQQTKKTPLEIEFRSNRKTGTIFLAFPHHGEWVSDKTEYHLEDILGLFSLTFYLANPLLFKVYPPSVKSQDLPLPSNTEEESLLFNYEQQSSDGDYYDLKKYHPADGLRKIIWRIFAKHGELVSRHPEKINYLDDTCMILYLGNQQTEKLAGTCVNYLRTLSREEVRFCLFSLISQQAARSLEGAEDIILESAWQNNSFVYQSKQPNRLEKALRQKATNYLVFADADDSLMPDLRKHCRRNNIKLHCCLQSNAGSTKQNKIIKQLSKLIYDSGSNSAQTTEQGEIINA